MLILFILIIVLGIFDIYKMYSKNQKKEIIVYIGMVIITLVFGYIYTSNSYKTSFSQIVMSFLGMNF